MSNREQRVVVRLRETCDVEVFPGAYVWMEAGVEVEMRMSVVERMKIQGQVEVIGDVGELQSTAEALPI